MSQNDATSNIISNLEGTNNKEKNYLFFNEAEKTKKITISFYDNYDKKSITKIKLFKNEKLVTDKIRVVDTSIHDGGQFTFELLNYVPFFNRIELSNQDGKILKLKTGDYFLEKVNIINKLNNENRWYLDSFNTTEGLYAFSFNSTFKRSIPIEEKVDLLISKKRLNFFSLNEKHNFYEKNGQLTFSYSMSSNNKEKGSYEILVIQSNKQNKNNIMNSIIVPLKP
jgi:hypothetical protein